MPVIERAPRRQDAPQRGEGGIVQAKCHADAEQKPGDHHHRDRIAAAEQRQSAASVRLEADSTGLPPADRLPADTRASSADITSEAEKAAKIQFEETPRSRAIDRPEWPADSSSMPMPVSASCQAPG